MAMLAGALLQLLVPYASTVIWLIALVWGGMGGIFTLAVISVSRQYSRIDLVGATAAVVFAYSPGAAISPALWGYLIELAPRYGFAARMFIWALAAMLGFEKYARGAALSSSTAGEIR